MADWSASISLSSLAVICFEVACSPLRPFVSERFGQSRAKCPVLWHVKHFLMSGDVVSVDIGGGGGFGLLTMRA